MRHLCVLDLAVMNIEAGGEVRICGAGGFPALVRQGTGKGQGSGVQGVGGGLGTPPGILATQ